MADSSQRDESPARATARPAEWALAAQAFLASGQKETAYKLALKIWNETSVDPEAAVLVSEVLSTDVPSWHFKVVRDHLRNAAYDAALRRAIRPGMRVLDIGSGTGLLALMAARAGADQVFSCEVNPAIADAAKEIVAINGFAKIIHVLDKHSTKLEADTDLDGRVDLIVSEVVSNNMLSEGVLTTMEHAVKNLLKPDGQVIPAKGGVRVALAFEPGFSERRMEITDGFDLTPFNRLAKPRYGIPTEDPHLRVMSEAVDLFEFDFRAATHEPEAHAQRTLTARGGSVNCIAQWIYLEMDEAAGYENRPGQATYSNWATMIHPLPRQGSLRAMDTITVNGSHDLCGLRIWV